MCMCVPMRVSLPGCIIVCLYHADNACGNFMHMVKLCGIKHVTSAIYFVAFVSMAFWHHHVSFGCSQLACARFAFFSKHQCASVLSCCLGEQMRACLKNKNFGMVVLARLASLLFIFVLVAYNLVRIFAESCACAASDLQSVPDV